MKNSLFSNFRTTLKNIHAMRILVIASFLLLGSQLDLLLAQTAPKLSIQGILKKSSGEAVPDGNYDLTFKLWTAQAPGGSMVWMETQAGLEVQSGIYSTVLGNSTSLSTVSFNQVYFLGVTVGTGGTEMTPRVQLTSAPYALSLIGNTNQFPSSGMVLADTLNIKTNVLARVGAPGAGGASKNGYAFNGTNGDKDSGLFSTGLGQASLYSNNIKMLTVTPDSVAIRSDVRLGNDANINYNGLDDWRLVDVDYFQNGNNYEGWQGYPPLSGQYIGWNNGGGAVNPVLLGNFNTSEGRYISISDNNQVLKKQFNLSNVGTYTYIKVKFKYYYDDIWEGDASQDAAFGAIANAADGTGMVIGYKHEGVSTEYYQDFNTTLFNQVNDWSGGGFGHPDFTDNGEMVFNKCNSCNNVFWLMFGAALNDPTNDEKYGVGMIEIWVK